MKMSLSFTLSTLILAVELQADCTISVAMKKRMTTNKRWLQETNCTV